MGARLDVHSHTQRGACRDSYRLCFWSLLLRVSLCLSPLLLFKVVLGHKASLCCFFQYQCLSPSTWRITLCPESPLSACSQPPHPGSFWFHAFMGDFMSSSVPERRSHPSCSSSLPGIPNATVNTYPPAPFCRGPPPQLVRVRFQGSSYFACS
jgi:hypothetical protein